MLPAFHYKTQSDNHYHPPRERHTAYGGTQSINPFFLASVCVGGDSPTEAESRTVCVYGNQVVHTTFHPLHSPMWFTHIQYYCTMQFDLTKSKEPKNTLKTPLDLKMDEFDKMVSRMKKDNLARIQAIKQKMVELSKEMDRCEDALEKLDTIH